jgi:hypothetical protein
LLEKIIVISNNSPSYLQINKINYPFSHPNHINPPLYPPNQGQYLPPMTKKEISRQGAIFFSRFIMAKMSYRLPMVGAHWELLWFTIGVGADD